MIIGKKIISMVLSILTLCSFCLMPQVKADNESVVLPNRENKSLSKSAKIGLGVGLGGGVPICVASGFAIKCVCFLLAFKEICN